MRLLACLAVLMLSACAVNTGSTPGSNAGASAESISLWEQKRALCQKQIEEKQYGTVEAVCQDALVAGRQIKGIQSLVSSGFMVKVAVLMGTSEAKRYKLDAALAQQPPATAAELAPLHASLGESLVLEKQSYAEAEQHLRIAMDTFDPRTTQVGTRFVAATKLSDALMAQRKYEDAAQVLESAMELPSLEPVSLGILQASLAEADYQILTAPGKLAQVAQKSRLEQRRLALTAVSARGGAAYSAFRMDDMHVECLQPLYVPPRRRPINVDALVPVHFRFTALGLATDVSVAKPSGLAEADQEAVALVSRIQCTVPPGKALPKIQMTLPINFVSGHTAAMERRKTTGTPATAVSPPDKKKR